MIAKGEKLPPRPTTSFAASKLSSNLFRVSFNTGHPIYSAAMKCSPMIPGDARKLFQEVLLACSKALNDTLGLHAVSGTMAFFTKKMTEKTLTIKSHPKYDLILVEKRTWMLDDKSKDKAQVALYLFLTLYKETFKKLGYNEGEKKTILLNNKEDEKVTGTKMSIRKGYEFKMHKMEGGVFLKVNPRTRIYREDLAIEMIDDIYHTERHSTREAIRQKVKAYFKGKLVMANYGSKRLHRVLEVVFDKDIREITIDPEGKLSLLQYYQNQYNITVRKPKTPLLKVETKGTTDIFLIPELCSMIGVPENLEEGHRRMIAGSSIKNPEEKMRPIKELIRQLASGEEFRQIGIEIQSRQEEVDCAIVKPREMKVGGDSVRTDGYQPFNLYDKRFYDRKDGLSIIMLHFLTNRSQVDNLLKLITKTSEGFGVTIRIAQQQLKR